MLVVLVALAVAVVVVPIAASRSARSPEQAYGEAISADRPVAKVLDGSASPAGTGLLAVAPRSILAGAQEAPARSLEFWARPRASRTGAAAGNKLTLGWGGTRVRFRARLAPRRVTHVVVEWSEGAIRLFYDGNLVDAVSVGEPSEVGRAHRVSITGPVGPAGPRAVALYRGGLEIRSIRRHYRLGLGLFGRMRPSGPEATGTPVARAAAVPGSTALPAITGTAKDGQTLTSSTGTWSGSPTSYARAWQRCDSAGANCAAISGATATTYLVASADVGKTIRVKVTATNSSGSGNATSAATAVVTAASPVNTALPAITGTAKDGQTLTSTTGTWTGTTPLSYARQWRRCDTAGANCADISAATGTTYVLEAADVAKTIKVVLTASNSAGSASAISAQTAAVTTAAPSSSGVPTISGTAKEGQQLSASTGTWTGSAPITYAYQWQSCNTSGASCTAISGATLSTYRLTATDVGKTTKVIVTAANGAGNASATSAATATITTGPPVNTSAPTLTGQAGDGQTLTTANGTWAGTATITYARQWKRCNNAGASCVSISGATGTTYTLTAADTGSTVRATWTATNSLGSASTDTPPSAVVAAQPPVNTVAPSITGTAKDGQTLTSATGTWTGSATITYTRQWKRCDSTGDNCASISGATGTTYVVPSSDIGSTIRVAITATNSAGTATATSPATASITGLAPTNSVLPAITGTAKDGQTLTAANGTWSGTSPITYARDWRRCDINGNNCVTISGQTSATYAVTGADVGKKLRVAITATNSAGTTTALSAATATVTGTAPTNTALPTITGTAKDGFRLQGSTGTWAGSAPINYAYQWQNCDASGANCVAQTMSTDSFAWLGSGDIGTTIRVKVTASNSAGSLSIMSAATDVVTTSPPVLETRASVFPDGSTAPVGLVDPQHNPIVGMDMAMGGDTWYGSAEIKETQQWQLCDGQGANCEDINKATKKSVRIGGALGNRGYIGMTFRVRVTATNPYGSASYLSDPSVAVADDRPINDTPPTVSGTLHNHLVVAATTGQWHGILPVRHTLHYWQRCDAQGDNCTQIDDLPDDEYEITTEDVGHRLRVIEDVSYNTDTFSDDGLGQLARARVIGPASEVVADGTTPPEVTLTGTLVDNPNAWLSDDSYTLSVSVTAGNDSDGLRSVAVMYDDHNVTQFDGCDGASCSITESVSVDTSDSDDGVASLWVVATDDNRTQTTEHREIRIDRDAPQAPDHVLVDMAADGTAKLTWGASAATDIQSYEILRRTSPDEPFTLAGTTEGTSFVDPGTGSGAGTAPLARMSAARFAVADAAPSGDMHVEYQVRTKDQAGETGDTTPTATASATPATTPAPASLNVAQPSASEPVHVTWEAAAGASGYALYRALDADAELMNNSGGTRGTPQLVTILPGDITDYDDTIQVAGRYTYTMRSVAPGGQLGAPGAPVTVVLQGTSIPVSQAILDHQNDVEAMLEAGGAPARERMTCPSTCVSLREAEIALPGSGAVADAIRDQLSKLRTRVGAWPKLAALTRANLLAADFAVGWTIGTSLRKAYFTEHVPPPTPEIHTRKRAHGGDVVGVWACTPDWWNSACIGNGGTSIIGHIYAPSAGAVGLGEANSQILYESWGPECSSTEEGPQPVWDLPGGWSWLTDIGPCPFWWAATDTHWVPFKPNSLKSPVVPPDVPGVDPGTIPTVPKGQPVLSEPDSIQQLLDALQSHAEEYPDLINWLRRRLGDSTAPSPDGTPACVGMTYNACVSAFKHAGFTGTITKKVLDPDDAWVGLPGGAVIDTDPWADEHVDNHDSPIEIEVNPDQMPDWTADDEQVDQQLGNRNIDGKSKPIIDPMIRNNVARQCRIRVQKALLPLSDCWTLPILITGGYDAMGPAQNDTDALQHNPRWVGVDRRVPPPRTEWYYNKPGPGQGCLRDEHEAKPYLDAECDEYPMWSMAQAKGGDLELETPYIRWTHKAENGRQGDVLLHFYNEKKGRKMLFDGCDIPITTIPVPLSVPERYAVVPTFLAIPVPRKIMPSYGVCNGRVAG